MIAPLRGNIIPLVKIQFLPGGILNGHVKLRSVHYHVNTQKPLFLRNLLTGLQGIVQQIAQQHAQVHILHGQSIRQYRLAVHPDPLLPGNGQFAVQYGVRHKIP